MRTFCIHCGAVDRTESLTCFGCGRLLISAGATVCPPAPTRDLQPLPRHLPQIAPPSWLPGPAYPSSYPRFGEGAAAVLRPYAAGLGLRSSAVLIDGITGCIALSGLFILLGVMQLAFGMSNGVAEVLAVLLLAWWPLYFVGCWASGGRTLGYRVAGLRLVRIDGLPPTLGTCLIRFIGVICSLTPPAARLPLDGLR